MAITIATDDVAMMRQCVTTLKARLSAFLTYMGTAHGLTLPMPDTTHGYWIGQITSFDALPPAIGFWVDPTEYDSLQNDTIDCVSTLNVAILITEQNVVAATQQTAYESALAYATAVAHCLAGYLPGDSQAAGGGVDRCDIQSKSADPVPFTPEGTGWVLNESSLVLRIYYRTAQLAPSTNP